MFLIASNLYSASQVMETVIWTCENSEKLNIVALSSILNKSKKL